MKNSVKHRRSKIGRSTSKRSLAVLKKLSGEYFKVGLIVAALFALAFAVETKAILALESSQDVFKGIPNNYQGIYR
jgi:hypothetical protein